MREDSRREFSVPPSGFPTVCFPLHPHPIPMFPWSRMTSVRPCRNSIRRKRMKSRALARHCLKPVQWKHTLRGRQGAALAGFDQQVHPRLPASNRYTPDCQHLADYWRGRAGLSAVFLEAARGTGGKTN